MVSRQIVFFPACYAESLCNEICQRPGKGGAVWAYHWGGEDQPRIDPGLLCRCTGRNPAAHRMAIQAYGKLREFLCRKAAYKQQVIYISLIIINMYQREIPGITAQPVAAAVSAVFRHEDMVSPAKKIIDIFQMLVGCFRITVGQDDNALRLVCKAAQIEDLFSLFPLTVSFRFPLCKIRQNGRLHYFRISFCRYDQIVNGSSIHVRVLLSFP